MLGNLHTISRDGDLVYTALAGRYDGLALIGFSRLDFIGLRLSLTASSGGTAKSGPGRPTGCRELNCPGLREGLSQRSGGLGRRRSRQNHRARAAVNNHTTASAATADSGGTSNDGAFVGAGAMPLSVLQYGAVGKLRTVCGRRGQLDHQRPSAARSRYQVTQSPGYDGPGAIHISAIAGGHKGGVSREGIGQGQSRSGIPGITGVAVIESDGDLFTGQNR